MIKSYLYTIGKHLTPSQRNDVLKEIEANLYDYLEENFGDKEYTEEEVEKAIRSMGHPQKVAEAYMDSPRSLIGPTYIDTYWLIVKIAIISATSGLIIANVFSIPDPNDLISLFIKSVAEILQTALSITGLITLIFAAISFYSPQELTRKDGEWSLSILDREPALNEKINVFELIVETFFICLTLVFFAQISPSLPFTRIINFAYFSPALVWIFSLLGSSLLLNFYLLVTRHWQVGTRVISTIIDVLAIALVTKLAFSPEILDWSVILEKLGSDIDNATHWFQSSVYISVAVFVIIIGVEIFNHLKALLQTRKG